MSIQEQTTDIKMEEKILAEINLTHTSLDEGVKHITEWIQKSPHLPNETDENYLKAYIVGSKSVERAKERLEKYFTVKSMYPKCFHERDPLDIKWPSVEKLVRLPKLTPDGSTIFLSVVPTDKMELELFDLHESFKVFFMMLDRMHRTVPIVSGHYVIMDCKGLSAEMVLKCISTFAAAAFNIYQGCMPIRVKALICFNAGSAADMFCNKVLKVFLSEKLRDKIYAHAGDHTTLSQYFPLDLMPEDYGGKEASVNKLLEERRLDLESDREWFLNNGCLGSDESKRLKQENDSENIQGTFRKLDVN